MLEVAPLMRLSSLSILYSCMESMVRPSTYTVCRMLRQFSEVLTAAHTFWAVSSC